MIIDTHTHLYAEELEDIDGILERAKEAGVAYAIMPNIDASSIAPMRQLAAKDKGFYRMMMGLHPTSIKDDWQAQIKLIEEELHRNSSEYIAIGETGLDYYWDTTYKREQQYAFAIQLQWAKEAGKPISMHTRNSFHDALRLVKEAQDGQLQGIFHCFSGSADDIIAARDAGMHIGIGGNITYKNNKTIEALKEVGLSRVVLETDAPYLAPTPKRGKTNEPSYLVHVVAYLSVALDLSTEELEDTTSANAQILFSV